MKDKFKVELLDSQKLISVNNLEEISNPIFFVRDNIPTSDGLLSNDIFGISKNDRANIFAYIDLNGQFLHPLIYRVWGRLDNRIKDLVHGTKSFIIKNGDLIEDENGDTGIDFLRKNINNIKIKSTESRKRDVNIEFIEKNRANIFIKQCIVIPAYYRDVNSADGNIGVGDINKLYNSLIISTKALKQTLDYGNFMTNTINGRIQETLSEIYYWFSSEPNLAKKNGIIRRSVLSKTTDYASRLVISSPSVDYDRPEDLMVTMDQSAVPLSSLCVNLYPYVLFNLRRFFENEFSSPKYPYIDKQDEIKYVTLKDIEIEFSDDRLKKEINRFIRGFSNRFIPVQVPNEEGKEIYMKFKGRSVPLDKINDPGNSPLLNRRLTWCDLLYMSAVEASKDKHVLITRYPLEDYFGQFPTRIVVSSTKETEPMFIDNTVYTHYPKIREEDIGGNTSNKFIDTLHISNLYLPAIGGDYRPNPYCSLHELIITLNKNYLNCWKPLRA